MLQTHLLLRLEKFAKVCTFCKRYFLRARCFLYEGLLEELPEEKYVCLNPEAYCCYLGKKNHPKTKTQSETGRVRNGKTGVQRECTGHYCITLGKKVNNFTVQKDYV